MAKNYRGRVNALKARRQGLNVTKDIEKSLATNVIALDGYVKDSYGLFEQEEYETRTNSAALIYALGAMQQVDEKYTSISFDEAKRVSSQVITELAKLGESATAELQGSLLLNVHLRRTSDVDLLILSESFCVYSSLGVGAHRYTPSDIRRSDKILQLRENCFDILKRVYYAARVDNSGAKCITMTGGSLKRDVDIVPAIWFDGDDYQTSLNKTDRGVMVYNRFDKSFLTNYPFKVRSLIDSKDIITSGGCKKVIRLLKTLKTDAEIDIPLSSFDIMSIVFAMENSKLSHQRLYEGLLILSIRDWLSYLISNPAFLRSLNVIDGSRKIITSKDSEEGVISLFQELKELVEKIGEELAPYDYQRRPNVLKESIL